MSPFLSFLEGVPVLTVDRSDPESGGRLVCNYWEIEDTLEDPREVDIF